MLSILIKNPIAMAKKVQGRNYTNNNAVKGVFGGKCIALNPYIRKEERFQISGLNQRSPSFGLWVRPSPSPVVWPVT